MIKRIQKTSVIAAWAIMLCSIAGSASDLNTTIRDMSPDGFNERGGLVAIALTEPAFIDATPENPVFLFVSLSSGATLAQTLVDLDLPDQNRQHQPIYLPLFIEADLPEFVQCVAPQDTLSVVRWVAGEAGFWLRVQRPMDTWVEAFFSPVPIDARNPAFFIVGRDAEQNTQTEDLYFENKANLPYPTRQVTGQLGPPTSVMNCMDLRNAWVESAGANPNHRIYAQITAHRVPADIVLRQEAAPDSAQLPKFPIGFRGEGIIGRPIASPCTFTAFIEPATVCATAGPAPQTITAEWEISNPICSYQRSDRYHAAFDADSGAGFAVSTDAQGNFADAEAVSYRRNTVLLAADVVGGDRFLTAFADRDQLFQVGDTWYAREAQIYSGFHSGTLNLSLTAVLTDNSFRGALNCQLSAFNTDYSASGNQTPRGDQETFCGPYERSMGSHLAPVATIEACVR